VQTGDKKNTLHICKLNIYI
jgi:hypothetical protein